MPLLGHHNIPLERGVEDIVQRTLRTHSNHAHLRFLRCMLVGPFVVDQVVLDLAVPPLQPALGHPVIHVGLHVSALRLRSQLEQPLHDPVGMGTARLQFHIEMSHGLMIATANRRLHT